MFTTPLVLSRSSYIIFLTALELFDPGEAIPELAPAPLAPAVAGGKWYIVLFPIFSILFALAENYYT